MIAALAGPVHGVADYEHNRDKDNNRGSFQCDLHYCEAPTPIYSKRAGMR
jgi:hypothetical protein